MDKFPSQNPIPAHGPSLITHLHASLLDLLLQRVHPSLALSHDRLQLLHHVGVLLILDRQLLARSLVLHLSLYLGLTVLIQRLLQLRLLLLQGGGTIGFVYSFS